VKCNLHEVIKLSMSPKMHWPYSTCTKNQIYIEYGSISNSNKAFS